MQRSAWMALVSLLVACDGSPASDKEQDSAVDDTDTAGCVDSDATSYADLDGDGFGDPNTMFSSCDAGFATGVADNTDCDDGDAALNPAAAEVCDTIDNDCDSLVDEADDSLSSDVIAYPDADGDSYGDASAEPRAVCALAAGDVDNADDCDDVDGMIHPGVGDVPCDGIDSDCKAATPYGEIEVPGDQPTIQAALDAAASGDTVCVAAGTYHENLTFGTANIAVQSVAGAEATIIDGSDLGTTIYFPAATGDYSPTLDGFTVQGGLGIAYTDERGGGIWVGGNAEPVFRNVVIAANRADIGGGMYVDFEGSVTMTDVTFQGNFADSYGGALANDGYDSVIDLRGVEMVENATTGGQFTGGAGIWCGSGFLLIDDATFTDNRPADYAGGVGVNENCQLTMTDTTMTGNAASFRGDAIWAAGEVDIQRTTILANGDASSTYGAVALASEVASFKNVIIAGNTVAGVYASSSGSDMAVDLINVSIVGNGWGLDLGQDYNDTTVNLQNSIVAFNERGEYAATFASTASVTVDASYNDMYGSAVADFQGEAVDWTGTDGNVSVDPIFMSFDVATDPPTWDLHLDAPSPLLDGGDPSMTDPDGSRIQVGAYGGVGAW